MSKHDKHTEGFDSVEGVPEWMWTSLLLWLMPILSAVRVANQDLRVELGMAPPEPSPTFVLMAERQFRTKLDFRLEPRTAIESLVAQMRANHDLALQVLALALDQMDMGYLPSEQEQKVAELNAVLMESGSVWYVASERVPEVLNVHPFGQRAGYRVVHHLRRRSSPEASSAIARLLHEVPRSATHLSSAWNLTFGPHPNPGEAYQEAVKAVEAAAIPVVSPKNDRATLGSVIRDMRAAPSKWSLVVESGVASPRNNVTELNSIDVVIVMADLLWRNQTDRHGVPEGRTALVIEQAQAELAVHLATTFVFAFTHSIE